MIVIQKITTTWTKKSRGGAEAAVRNAVPQALPIPVSLLGEDEQPELLTHGTSFVESNGFKPTGELLTTEPLLSEKEFKLELIGDELKVCICCDKSYRHRAFRYFAGPDKFRCLLQQGQWVQAIGMRRELYGMEGFWQFSKYVFNIGLVRNKFYAKDCFLQRAPDYVFHPKVDLW